MAVFVAALPSPYREAITLTELQGMTQKDAAEMLGISLSGMKSRVQRGRQQISEMLQACCEIALDARGHVVSFDRRVRRPRSGELLRRRDQELQVLRLATTRRIDPEIRSLLSDAGLITADVDTTRQVFIVAVTDGRTDGCVGLEPHGRVALLRSLAVRDERRGSGIGGALLERARQVAVSNRVETLYLLTTNASPFFGRRGFVAVARSTVPDADDPERAVRSAVPDQRDLHDAEAVEHRTV